MWVNRYYTYTAGRVETKFNIAACVSFYRWGWRGACCTKVAHAIATIEGVCEQVKHQRARGTMCCTILHYDKRVTLAVALTSSLTTSVHAPPPRPARIAPASPSPSSGPRPRSSISCGSRPYRAPLSPPGRRLSMRSSGRAALPSSSCGCARGLRNQQLGLLVTQLISQQSL